MSQNTKRITESAMLLAMAIVLELVSKMFIPELPFGGQITLVSMLPVVLISYRHGIKWGLIAGVAYACIEMILGKDTISRAFTDPNNFGGPQLMILKALVMCLLDYLVAFTAVGLGGLFRNRISKPGAALACGSVVALLARYATHVLSGCILYSSWAEWFFTQESFPAWGASIVSALTPGVLGFVYSLVYNGVYMIPEIIFTAIASVLIARIPGIVKKVS